MSLVIDFTPLKSYRDFRFLYVGQFVSFLGSMTTYVAIPYQIYALTHSTFYVGLVSIVQLVPVLIFGLLGGSAADRFNRRSLLLISEVVMSVASLGLAANAGFSHPSVIAIFTLTFLMQSASAYHRPTFEAMAQKMVKPEHYPSMQALKSFSGSFAMIVGPALGGWLIANFGATFVFLFDLSTFLFAMVTVLLLRHSYAAERGNSPTKIVADIKEGFRFAIRTPAILGTYLIDIVAMTFAFPYALFPAIAEQFGEKQALGWLYSAGAIGSLIATLFSGYAGRIRYRGRMVCFAAAAWGLAIVGFGLSRELIWALGFLVLAGGLDMVSALYRGIIWNEIIPNKMRGRLGGLEMISYMSGPLLGNFRAGSMADGMGLGPSVKIGGYMCVVGVAITAWRLREFWMYRPANNNVAA